MTSRVELFNRVLFRFAFGRIDDPDAADHEVIVLNEFYPQARDEVLMLRPWSCSIKRRKLALIAEDNPKHAWKFVYQLPVDDYCLEVLALLDSSGEWFELDRADYEIEAGDRLYTNQRSVGVRYVSRIDVHQMDPHVVSVMIAKLAVHTAIPLKESIELDREMRAVFENTFVDASATENRIKGTHRLGDVPRSKVAGGTAKTRFHKGV